MPWVWVNEFLPMANQTVTTGSLYYNPWTSTATSITSSSTTLYIPSPIWVNIVGTLEVPDPPRIQRESIPAVARARENAEEFLLQHLSEEQRNTFIAAGFFVVIGQRTRKKYRIERHSFTGNIHEMNAHDQVTHRLCCHLAGNIPLADHLLAQKLSLEADEETFLRLANRNEVVRR